MAVLSSSYKPPTGDYDAMHSFQSRKSDGFGGKMHEKIGEALKSYYNTYKKNPYVSSIKITCNDTNWIVNWEVTIDESPDGNAYIGITSRGGAGTTARRRAWTQFKEKRKALPGEVSKNTKIADIIDFNFKTKISNFHIRQIFALYTNPETYPNLPKSEGLPSATVGFVATETIATEDNNGKVVLTSTVAPAPGSSSETLSSSTTTDVAKGQTPSVGTIDGTAQSSGKDFQFVKLKESFISVPPRRGGSLPVFLFYPKTEVFDTEEEIRNGMFSFSLGNDSVSGTQSGIKLANRVLKYDVENFRKFGNDVDKELTAIKESPLKDWFNKYVMVFANDFSTDYNKLLDEITNEIEGRTLTRSTLNLVLFGESAHPTTPLMQSLTNAVKNIKTLTLVEPFPSTELLNISTKVKSSGGEVYYTYSPNNLALKIEDTKSISLSGLSYSGLQISPSSTSTGLYDYIPTGSFSMFLNGITISSPNSSYRNFVRMSYEFLNPLVSQISSSASYQSVTYSFMHRGLQNNELTFTYSYLYQDLIKSGAFVYNISETAEKNKENGGGTTSKFPSLSIDTTQATGQSGSTVSYLADYTVRYLNLDRVSSNLSMENMPEFAFEIFSNDIQKVIGKAASPATANDPAPPKLRGEFIFDVRKSGYLINDQLGEFKIVGKVEIDPFVASVEDDLSGLAPEYTEVEFAGEEEAPENLPDPGELYLEDEGSSEVNDTTTSEVNSSAASSGNSSSGSSVVTPAASNPGPLVKLPTGSSAYSHNSTQGYNLVDSKWYGDLLTSALAHIDHPTFDIPGTQKGALGCASWVSMVFYRAFGVHMKDGKAVKKIPKSIGDFGSEGTGALGSWFAKNPTMWEKIPWKEGKPGDVINTERREPKAGHVGIVMDTINKDGSYNVASNSSKGFGSSSDPQGCGKLNYSIKKWQSVTDRNPSGTFCWRYKGPKLSPGQTA